MVHGAVRRARATINVTPLWCERDAADFRKEVLYIPHGFPPELLVAAAPPPPPPGPVQVGYFGQMINGGFNYADWFAGLAATEPGAAVFRYAGGQHAEVREIGHRAGLHDRVIAEGRVAMGEVFRRQREMDVLLTFSRNDPENNGYFGFKLAELMAAGRPVLVVGPPDESLRSTLAKGTRVLWATNPGEVTATLGRLIQEKRNGGVHSWTDQSVIREQAWDSVAARLLAELNRLLRPQREALNGTYPQR
jgi:glycosyltransferase involved in cell wall biosynthesis